MTIDLISTFSTHASGVRYSDFLIEWIFYWIESSQIKIFESIFELNFLGKKIIEWFFEVNIPEKNYIEYSFELNFIVKWMNESYFESIFAIFDEKPPFLSILDTFWAIFGQFSHSTSINDPLSFEMNNLLNWISRFF